MQNKNNVIESEQLARQLRRNNIRALVEECELKTLAELFRRTNKLAAGRIEESPKDGGHDPINRISQWSEDQFRKCLSDGHALYGNCLALFSEVLADAMPSVIPRRERIAEILAKLWGSVDDGASPYSLIPPNQIDAGRQSPEVDAWAIYDSSLAGKITAPVPGGAIPLSDLYVPLRAKYNDTLTRSPHLISLLSRKQQQKEDSRSDYVKVCVDLWILIEQWLIGDIESYDSVRLVRGGPGSGKSTFAKYLAHRLKSVDSLRTNSHLRICHVLLISLQYIPSDLNDAGMIISWHMQNHPAFSAVSPSFSSFNTENRLLLLFDGLDELSRDDEAALERSRTFLASLQSWLALRNVDGVTTVAIVFGRDAVVQKAELTLGLAPHQTLEILPYIIAERGLVGNQELIWSDQRKIWWKKWAKIHELHSDELPITFNKKGLFELSTEPLLLYIMAFTRIYEDQGVDGLSRFALYNLVLTRVISNWHNRAGRSDVEFPADPVIIRLLEIIAVSAWIDGGRVTSGTRALELCQGDETLKEELKGILSGREIFQALLAFYMRFGGDLNDAGIEFSHKSFCEFLVSRHLERLTFQVLVHKGGDLGEIYDDWTVGLARRPINEEIASFLGESVGKWTQKQKAKATLSALSMLQTIANEGGSANELMRENVCKESAAELIIVIISAIGPTASYFDIGWRTPKDAQRLFDILSVKSPNVDWTWRHEYTSLTPEEVRPSASRFAFFDFSGQSLIYARFVGMNFLGCQFANCDLRGADFIDCVASGACFDGANLQASRWNGTNISGATFVQAKIEGADFSLSNGITDGQFVNSLFDKNTKFPATPETGSSKRLIMRPVRG